MGRFARVLGVGLSIAIIMAACGGSTPTGGTAPSLSAGGSAPAANIDQAKKDATANGLTFAMTHDEIVQKANAEGSLRALLSIGKDPIAVVIAGFKKAYPNIKLEIQETTGSDAQRFLLELQAGSENAKSWDITHISQELYKDVAPFIAPYDVLGMAQQKVLAIDPRMIDPRTRSAIATGSATGGFTFNKKLTTADKMPKTWEDFLKADYKGKKFVTDIEPTNLAALVPLKGEEWVIDYAKKIAAQQPIWTRGDTKSLTAMAAGEYTFNFAGNYHSAIRAQKLAPDALQIVVLDPAPIRLAQLMGLLKTAKHPYASLLFFEWMAGPEGQAMLDEAGPAQGSVFATGSLVNKATQGKQISVVNWDQMDKLAGWANKIVEAWGFPKSETP